MSNLLAILDDRNSSAPPTGPASVFGTINPPSPIQDLVNQGGAKGLGTVIGNLITLIFNIAIILFVFMVIISALQWILSGGDKEKVASARNRLTYAVIGVVILGLTWVITRTVGDITGVPLPFK